MKIHEKFCILNPMLIIFECQKCGLKFKNKKFFENHKCITKQNSEKIKCQFCRKRDFKYWIFNKS